MWKVIPLQVEAIKVRIRKLNYTTLYFSISVSQTQVGVFINKEFSCMEIGAFDLSLFDLNAGVKLNQDWSCYFSLCLFKF